MVPSNMHKSWKYQWRLAARKVLSLPDAAQVRMKHEVRVNAWIQYYLIM